MLLPFLLRSITFLCVLFTFFYVLHQPASAQEEFNITYDASYVVQADGSAKVSQNITLQNKLSKIYANSYTFTIEGKAPKDITVRENQKELVFESREQELTTNIIVSFDDALVGKDKLRQFTISYILPKVGVKNGEVWEVSIPKLSSPELISQYNLKVQVPKEFGAAAYISPQPYYKGEQGANHLFQFSKDDLTRAGVVAAFGDFQVFEFNLKYHLKNPNSQAGKIELALIPDTAYQRVYYESIVPKPKSIRLDEDGNWMAIYALGAQEQIDIDVLVSAQVFSKPQEFYPKISPLQNAHYLSQTQSWQTTDPKIVELAAQLKTPKLIYNYTVGKLSYNYSRVQENSTRLGAVGALNNPEQAICMEFTDLFVAISRAAGIPAREINGYAYTENPKLQPLSLVADILHSWPEYWDSERQMWVPVDPTWEDTTGGVDFFNKFDLSHVTFVIHGKESSYPYPAGSYKDLQNAQKDVQVQFGSLPENKNILPAIVVIQEGWDFPFLPIKRKIKITNDSAQAFYNSPFLVSTSGENIKLLNSSSNTVDFLPPLSVLEKDVEFKISLIPNFDNLITAISLGDTKIEYNIDTLHYYLFEAIAVFILLLSFVVLVIFVFHLLPRFRKE